MLLDKSYWQKRVQRFLDKRIPKKRRFQLDMSNIFIFPSKFGLLYLALCLCLFLLGSNYNNNLMLLLCFFLVALFLINLSASYSNFAKIQIQMGRLNPVFAGEDVNIPLWFEHAGEQEEALPYFGKIYIKLYGQAIQNALDPQHFSNPTSINLSTEKRGYLALPRITLESFYPVGLYRCWTHLLFQGSVLVYPKPVPCQLPALVGRDENEQEETESHHAGMEDFDTLSAYQHGEPMHQVAWKQVAKGQGMVSKRFTGASGQSVWLSLAQLQSNGIELALSQLTWLVLESNKKNRRFGLDLGSQQIPPGSGAVHMEKCLQALALYGSSGNME